MTDPRVPPAVAKRRWYALAQRHRRMAERMLRSGFPDGALFHAYHAYECAVSALIAGNGLPVPTDHARRLVLYERLLNPERPYAETQTFLRPLTARTRNNSLYYDEGTDQSPTDRFDSALVSPLLVLVHRFAREVWAEIR